MLIEIREIHGVEQIKLGKLYKWNYGHEHFPDVPKKDFIGKCIGIKHGQLGLEAIIDFKKAIVNVAFVNEMLYDDTLVEVEMLVFN